MSDTDTLRQRAQAFLAKYAALEATESAPALDNEEWNKRATSYYYAARKAAPDLVAGLLAEVERAECLFEALTPGGSEFCQDWRRCVDYALERQRGDQQKLVAAKIRERELEARVEQLEGAVIRAHFYVAGKPTERDVLAATQILKGVLPND